MLMKVADAVTADAFMDSEVDDNDPFPQLDVGIRSPDIFGQLLDPLKLEDWTEPHAQSYLRCTLGTP